MLRNLLLILALAGIAGCDTRDAGAAAPAGPVSSPPPSRLNGLPLLRVDAQHWLREQGLSGKPYLADAGAGVFVDGHSFLFRDPQKLGRQPNVIRMLYGQSEYSSPWPQNGLPHCRLDGSTLRIVKGSAFAGFEPGQQAFIGIGYESADNPSQETVFREFWVASVIFH